MAVAYLVGEVPDLGELSSDVDDVGARDALQHHGLPHHTQTTAQPQHTQEPGLGTVQICGEKRNLSCHVIYHTISYRVMSCHIISHYIIYYVMSEMDLVDGVGVRQRQVVGLGRDVQRPHALDLRLLLLGTVHRAERGLQNPIRSKA